MLCAAANWRADRNVSLYISLGHVVTERVDGGDNQCCRIVKEDVNGRR